MVNQSQLAQMQLRGYPNPLLNPVQSTNVPDWIGIPFRYPVHEALLAQGALSHARCGESIHRMEMSPPPSVCTLRRGRATSTPVHAKHWAQLCKRYPSLHAQLRFPASHQSSNFASGRGWIGNGHGSVACLMSRTVRCSETGEHRPELRWR